MNQLGRGLAYEGCYQDFTSGFEHLALVESILGADNMRREFIELTKKGIEDGMVVENMIAFILWELIETEEPWAN